MQNNDFENNDDLNLFNTLIESVKITFNPKRNIEFSILKPDNENKAKYLKGSLKLINVFDSNMSFENNYDDYPEFYRSAILNQSDYLIKLF